MKIATIHDYPSTANAGTQTGSDSPPNGVDFTEPYSVARAGLLKLRFQALNDLLTRTPIDQHAKLQFDDIVKGISSRTYVDGAEQVYFLTKTLSWADDIPVVFFKAYSEVLQLRHFTNAYTPKPWKQLLEKASRNGQIRSHPHMNTIAAQFATTFSTIRPKLRALDAMCGTTINHFFQEADKNVKPFPFLRLPSELRLRVYDYLIPHSAAYMPMYSRRYPRRDGSLPENLAILRVNNQIHNEVTKHCFDQHVLVMKACRNAPRRPSKECFTRDTSGDYAERYTGILGSKFGRKITRLEIQILPSQELDFRPHPGNDGSPATIFLRQIIAALPNLDSILFSYPKFYPDPYNLSWHGVNRNRSITLEWIRNQLRLPVGGPPHILWDLTCLRDWFDDMERLGKDVLSERVMKQLIEDVNGGLALADSATASKEDLQRWSEIKHTIMPALKEAQKLIRKREWEGVGD